jgi:glycosyltransferase involved in cell wall biosynthesis
LQVTDERPLRGVRVLQLGHFDPEYSRNRIMRKALVRAGASVRVLTDPRSFAARTPGLARDALRDDVDAILVGFPGHADVALARAVGMRLRAPVIFDAFVSLYESSVGDRRTVARGSLGSYRYALEDWLASAMATRVVLDTDTHADYFAEVMHVPRRRLRRVWVGADDDVVRPGPAPDPSRFQVFVYASFIPLHGLEHVVAAAQLLEHDGEDIAFTVVGDGDERPAIEAAARSSGVTNLEFVGWQPYRSLPALMSRHHVCLGIFGTSGKARRVIPNKVFDALAIGRPVVTSDTPAAREALTHRHDSWLCAPGSGEAIAEALVALRDDLQLREAIGRRGHRLFLERFSIDALGRDLAGLFLDVLDDAR